MVLGVLVAAAGAWAWPRPDSLSWADHAAPESLSRRIAAPVRSTVVLDQWGNVRASPPAVRISTSNPDLADIDAAGSLVPHQDGTVEVIATLPSGSRGLARHFDREDRTLRYAVTLDLPPLLDGTWIARARGKRITRTDVVRARETGPGTYEVTRNMVFTRGNEVEHYLARNNWTSTTTEVCEDNPFILPPDAPVSTLTQCSRVVSKERERVVLDSPDIGTYELRRATLEDFDILHDVATADLDALRDAAVTYKSRNGRFLAIGDESGARADARMGPRRYQADGASVTLGWEPRACVRRQQCVTDVGYWVESDGTSFTAHAFLDSDGDGTLAEYIATAEQHARRVTDAAVR